MLSKKGLEESLMGVMKDTEVDIHALWAICGTVGFEWSCAGGAKYHLSPSSTRLLPAEICQSERSPARH